MELRVVFGKHEVACEFAGEPNLEALHATVHKALCGLGQQLSPLFRMNIKPEGQPLSDDSSVAALSSGSTIEVLPMEPQQAQRILKEKGFHTKTHFNQAVLRGDAEIVRLMLAAWGDLEDFVRYPFYTAVVTRNLPMCRIMFSHRWCFSLVESPGFEWHRWGPLTRQSECIDGLQSRDLVQMLRENGFTKFGESFFIRAAERGRDWVFNSCHTAPEISYCPAVRCRILDAAVRGNSFSTVRAAVTMITLPPDWFFNTMRSAMCSSSDRTDLCRLLVELGATVPQNTLLKDATCLGFFDVLIARGADLEHRSGERDCTPLITATCPCKQQALIKLGANVNARDSTGFHILMRDPANLDVMSLAITRGADVNAADNTGKTCLMHVCAQGKCPPASLLLDHGAEVNASDSTGKTCLMYRAQQGDCPTVSLLLDRGADLEATDAEGATALWYADTKEVLMLLMQRGAALNIRDGKGHWLLHTMYHPMSSSRSLKDVLMLEALVAQPHLDVNVADSTGCTVLMRAAQSEDSVAFLLEHADIDVGVQDSGGMTCLMHAASAKRLAVCKEILGHLKAAKRRTAVAVQDCYGWTCLMHALSDVNCETWEEDVRTQLVVSLLSHGADPSVNVDGLTALHMAVAIKSADAFGKLLAAGASPNVCDGGGLPLLHNLVSKNVALFEALVASPGLDINVRGSNGRTALMQAARSSGMAKCTALLQKGADIDAQDSRGWTCLGHAAASGGTKVVTLLLDHGAGINDGAVPPLLAAVLAANMPVCHLLLERGADVTKPAADGTTCVSVAARLRCRGAKAVLALVHDALGDGGSAEPVAGSTQGVAREAPASGSKRKRDDDEDGPAASTHACAVCGAVALASGEPFPSAESVLRHASSKHRMRRSEYTRRFGE